MMILRVVGLMSLLMMSGLWGSSAAGTKDEPIDWYQKAMDSYYAEKYDEAITQAEEFLNKKYASLMRDHIDIYRKLNPQSTAGRQQKRVLFDLYHKHSPADQKKISDLLNMMGLAYMNKKDEETAAGYINVLIAFGEDLVPLIPEAKPEEKTESKTSATTTTGKATTTTGQQPQKEGGVWNWLFGK